MKKANVSIGAIALLAVVGGALWAGGKTETAKRDKPVIAVSITPQQYFVERISGGLAETLVLVGPGQSPHSYEPTPGQLTALSHSACWVTSGTDFEIALLPKIEGQFKNLKIVDGTAGVRFRTLGENERELDEHEHGEDGHEEGEVEDGDHHDHGAEGAMVDRHTWLGREPGKVMAGHVRDALVAADPSNASVYESNYAALASDIDAVFESLTVKLASLRGTSVLVYHPAFGYFLDDFGIAQEAIETGGKEPTAKTLAAVIRRAQEARVPAIFVQAQFPVNAANTVAKEVGAKVVPLDPLAPDWLENLKRMGAALANAAR